MTPNNYAGLRVTYRGYSVPPELAIGVLAKLWEPVLRVDRTELREATQEQGDGPGYLVPPEVIVQIAVRLGMPRLPDRTKWDAHVHAKIGHKPRWWQWLFHNYSTNKVASFLVWRWPKFPGVVKAYDECFLVHQAEGERRVQNAYEFLRERRKECNLGEPIIMKATIGNLDGWRYCTMKVANNEDDDD